MNGCAVVVVGALGGAGVLTYNYASAHEKSATTEADPPTRADPPATGVNPFDASAAQNNRISTEAEAEERPGANSRPVTAETTLASTITGNLLLSPSYNPANPLATYVVPHPGGPTLSGLTSVTSSTVQPNASERNTLLHLSQ